MPLIITASYEQLLESTTEAVYYMEIQEGRNDSFIINAAMPGGAVMKVELPDKPADFQERYPNAIGVDMLDIT
jgi:hypothetical protein